MTKSVFIPFFIMPSVFGQPNLIKHVEDLRLTPVATSHLETPSTAPPLLE